MRKFTGEKWKFGKNLGASTGVWCISLDCGENYRGMAIAETCPGSGDELFNARLVAAAPELLIALEKMLSEYECLIMGTEKERWPEAATAARSAIAKAKGSA